MDHHNLDTYPKPKEKTPLYVNEPWVVDITIGGDFGMSVKPDSEDNIRI